MYVDMHNHLIWGMDDGAENKEETFRMLDEAAEDNIHTIICTPHVTPGVYEFPEQKFLYNLREARNYIQQECLQLTLFTGAEILYTDSTPRLLREGRIPTLAGSEYVLVEFSPTESREHIFSALQKIAGAGFRPIIAHMERYPAIRTLDQVREMKSRYQALIQINARSLIRKQPFFRRPFFDGLFEENLADFVATDAHALPGRNSCMREGMAALQERYGSQTADRIRKMPETLLIRY